MNTVYSLRYEATQQEVIRAALTIYGEVARGNLVAIVDLLRTVKTDETTEQADARLGDLTEYLHKFTHKVTGENDNNPWEWDSPQTQTNATKARNLVEKFQVSERFTTNVTTLDLEEWNLVTRALEYYSRVHMGQISWDTESLVLSYNHPQRITNDAWDELLSLRRSLDDLIPLATGLAPNAYYGISHEALPDAPRVAFDLYQVIRHRLAWDQFPEGGHTVNFNTPMRTSTAVKLGEFYPAD